MFDPRDDTRDRGKDGRERANEGRNQTGDPRDVFLHDVDLPLEREREYVLDRDHVYELNGDDAARWPPSARSGSCPNVSCSMATMP